MTNYALLHAARAPLEIPTETLGRHLSARCPRLDAAVIRVAVSGPWTQAQWHHHLTDSVALAVRAEHDAFLDWHVRGGAWQGLVLRDVQLAPGAAVLFQSTGLKEVARGCCEKK